MDVPPDLPQCWLTAARPEGTRCCVVAARGSTTAYRRDGSQLARFQSQLPAGSAATAEGSESLTILDCVLHAGEPVLSVADAMVWRGYSLYDCGAEFRLYWLHTKLCELGAPRGGPRAWAYDFRALAYAAADAAGLHAAARGEVPFRRDGLLLVHRECVYSPGECTPLALQWKDGECSGHLLDTDAHGKPPPLQLLVLRLSPDGWLMTGDAHPLARLVDCLVGTHCAPHPAGALLRLAVPPGALAMQHGRPGACAPLTLLGEARRGHPADAASKIAFQYAARAGEAPTLQQLMDQAAA